MSANPKKTCYKCDVCGREFRIKSKLTMHMRIHTNYRPFKCDICKNSFMRSDHLKIHMTKHTGDKTFSCELCQSRFPGKTNLRSHMKIHTQEKNFECEICDKKFRRMDNYKTHMLLHKDKRPHVCNVCGVGLTTNSNLRAHLRRHNGHRPYKCNMCLESFGQLLVCRRHILKNHVGTSADASSKSLLYEYVYEDDTKEQINVKQGVREKEGVFKCDLCNKSFKRKHDLNIHSKSHSEAGRKLEIRKCYLCQKIFDREIHLSNHMSIKHGVGEWKQLTSRCRSCGNTFPSKYKRQTHDCLADKNPPILKVENQCSVLGNDIDIPNEINYTSSPNKKLQNAKGKRTEQKWSSEMCASSKSETEASNTSTLASDYSEDDFCQSENDSVNSMNVIIHMKGIDFTPSDNIMRDPTEVNMGHEEEFVDVINTDLTLKEEFIDVVNTDLILQEVFDDEFTDK